MRPSWHANGPKGRVIRMTSIYHASDGAALAFSDRGQHEGLGLMFVHGWQADSRVWDPLVEHLGPEHRVITVDLRGFGGSHAAPGPYALETFSGDLCELVEFLDLDPLVVVGHSMGAAVAQRFAIDHPDAVEGLILIAPVPASGVPFPAKTVDFFRSTAGNPERAAHWLKQLTLREPPAHVTKLLQDAATTVPAEVALESLRSWQEAEFADEAATIETPTLILAPSDDWPIMTPAFLKEKIGDVIAGSTLEIVEESGHYAPVEQPAWLAARIERFLEEL